MFLAVMSFITGLMILGLMMCAIWTDYYVVKVVATVLYSVVVFIKMTVTVVKAALEDS